LDSGLRGNDETKAAPSFNPVAPTAAVVVANAFRSTDCGFALEQTTSLQRRADARRLEEIKL
jgi:hypothetical protein